MELQLILTLIRRWAWLLILGAIVGVGVGKLYSNTQAPVYQATTKVLVMGNPTQNQSDIGNFDSFEMVDTFIELLHTAPILDSAGETLGYNIGGGQISAKAVEYTRLMIITVKDGDPQHAAEIANELVNVLILYNEALQTDRYASSEESLQAQISQVEGQINQVQTNIAQGNNVENADIEQDLLGLQEELAQNIATSQAEIVQIELELESLTADPTAILTPVEQQRLQGKQNELIELQFKLDLDQKTYNSRLAEGLPRSGTLEQALLVSQAEIVDLEREIVELQNPINLDTRLSELRTQQAQLQFAMSLDEGRYEQLFSVYNNGGAQSSVRYDQDQATLNLYQSIYSELLNTYESVRLARLQNSFNVIHVEEATAPGSPIQPRPRSNMMLGMAVGLILMGGIAFMIEFLDNTLKTPDDITRVLKLPVIGFVAEVKDLEAENRPYVSRKPRSPIAEAFRSLRTNLEFAGVDQPLTTILVTSPGAGEGKTTVSSNLAVALAQNNRSAIILDADMRRPRVHQKFGLPNRNGLSELFLHELGIDDALQESGSVSNLTTITSGSLPPNPAELLASDSMSRILAELKAHADMVVIDSPPLVVSDAVVLSAKVDGVVLVIRPGKTDAQTATAALEQFQRAGANVVGVVLNRIPRRRPGYYGGYYNSYYYDRGYGYGLDDNDKGQSSRRKRQPRWAFWRKKSRSGKLTPELGNPQ